MKNVLCFMFMLLFYSSYANEVYNVRVSESDSIKLLSLSSINSMSVTIIDSINFDYRIDIDGVNLVDCKIYADAPLFDRVDGRISEIQRGFNVNFTSIQWLLDFLSRANLVVSESRQNTYLLTRSLHYDESVVSK